MGKSGTLYPMTEATYSFEGTSEEARQWAATMFSEGFPVSGTGGYAIKVFAQLPL